MKLNVPYYNFSNAEQAKYYHAFNVFDADNDDYLNRTEFASLFQLELNNSGLFSRMDVNNDNILSFGECVTWLVATNEIEEVHKSTFKAIGFAIKELYDFEYNIFDHTPQEKQLFFEYVALFTYFMPFDVESNGYIRADEFFLIASQNEFNLMDQDKNDKISLDELANLFYGKDDYSWSGIAESLFGRDYRRILEEMDQVQITKEMVQRVTDKLEVCPLTQGKKRRLSDDGPFEAQGIYCYYYVPVYGETMPWQCPIRYNNP